MKIIKSAQAGGVAPRGQLTDTIPQVPIQNPQQNLGMMMFSQIPPRVKESGHSTLKSK
jgi:hypothetical protein